MEVLGTLVGAAIQGQIVASAHTKKHCPIHNISAGHLGNSSGTEIIRSLLHSQDYLSHSVSVTCAQVSPDQPQTGAVVCSLSRFSLVLQGQKTAESLLNKRSSVPVRPRIYPPS